MLFIILLVNGGITLALFRKRRRLTVASTLIFHLTVADFMLSATTVPQSLAVLLRSPLASSWLCQLTAFFNRFAHCTSIYLITILTACRCYGIIKPLRYRIHIYKSKVNTVCFMAWFVSFGFALLPFLGWGKYEILDGECLCALDTHTYPHKWLVISVLFFILPSVINTLMFVCTVKSLKGKQKVCVSSNNLSQSESQHSVCKLSAMLGRKHKFFVVSSRRACESLELKELNQRTHSIELRRTKTPIQRLSFVDDSKLPQQVVCENSSAIHSNSRSEETKPKQALKIEVTVDVHHYNANTSDMDENENNSKRTTNDISPDTYSANQLCVLHRKRPIIKSEQNYQNLGNEKLLHLEIESHPLQNNQKESQDDNSIKANFIKRQKAISKNPGQPSRNHKKKGSKIFIVLLLFLCFEIFCGPIFLVRIYYIINQMPVPANTKKIAVTMNGFNSLINPFLYGLLDKEIRRKLMDILCCQKS